MWDEAEKPIRESFNMESLEPRRMLDGVGEAGPNEVAEWRWTQPSIFMPRNEAIATIPGGLYRGDLGRFEANLPPGDYAVEIDWGDGSATAGTLQRYTNTVMIIGEHEFSKPGTYKVVATVTTSDGELFEFYQDVIPFASPIQLVDQFASGYADAGQNHGSYHILLFPNGVDADKLVGSIDWGDGTTTQVMGQEVETGAWGLSADHLYANIGTYTVTFTATAPGAAGATETLVASEQLVIETFDDSEMVEAYDLWRAAILDSSVEPAQESVDDADSSSVLNKPDAPPPSSEPSNEADTLADLLELRSKAD